MARSTDRLIEGLSDKELRAQLQRANADLDTIERADPAQVLRTGQADKMLERGEQALAEAQLAELLLRERQHRAVPGRLRLGRMLADSARKQPPATRWLREAQKFSAPELVGETLVADRLTEVDATELERIVKKKREILGDEHAEPLTDAEKGEWERLLGKAAGDEQLFAKRRKEAAVKTKLNELKDQRKVAALPRQPLLTEPGNVQLPRSVYKWLVGDEARDGAWTLADLGLLAALLGAFANDDPSRFVGGRFEGEGADRALVVPGGVGADLRMHGKIAGSAIETDKSGHVRVRAALRVLARNDWLVSRRSLNYASAAASGR
jgi:hypothetical protein